MPVLSDYPIDKYAQDFIPFTNEILMKQLTLEQHRARIRNLRRAREEIHSCTRELRIHDYLPGQIIYYLGDYPAPMSITPTEYDYNLTEIDFDELILQEEDDGVKALHEYFSMQSSSWSFISFNKSLSLLVSIIFYKILSF